MGPEGSKNPFIRNQIKDDLTVQQLYWETLEGNEGIGRN